jgi:hypothetical protein
MHGICWLMANHELELQEANRMRQAGMSDRTDKAHIRAAAFGKGSISMHRHNNPVRHTAYGPISTLLTLKFHSGY